MDLSYLQALMGDNAETPGDASGGVWVVSPTGVAPGNPADSVDDGTLRLVGKARVVADALGAYVHLLLGADPGSDVASAAFQAGADRVWPAHGVPTVADLDAFFCQHTPQVVLLPRTYLGRILGPGLAQALGGGLAGYAADLAVDGASQRVIALQPVLEDRARQNITILASPAVAVVDISLLPPPFAELWRSGHVEPVAIDWHGPPLPYPANAPPADLPVLPPSVSEAAVLVSIGRGLGAEGVPLARQLAERLGGLIAGDLGALDAGWIVEDQLVDLTGRRVAPRVYLALGIEGDTGHLMALQDARTVFAVQSDPTAPIVQAADWNVIADPAQFARAMLDRLG